MNKLIKELAEQAGAPMEYSFVAGATVWSLHQSVERLAQLIVRECAKRSEELGQPELGKGLMKHFGIEQ